MVAATTSCRPCSAVSAVRYSSCQQQVQQAVACPGQEAVTVHGQQPLLLPAGPSTQCECVCHTAWSSHLSWVAMYFLQPLPQPDVLLQKVQAEQPAVFLQ